MDSRLGYAILASCLLHGVMIAVWPRIKLPPMPERPYLTSVKLIEESVPLHASEGQPKDMSPRQAPEEIFNLGKKITDRVFEGIGTRSWEEYDLSIPDIRLPKQTPVPHEEEYAMIWAEEIPHISAENMGTYSLPLEEKGHKAFFFDSGRLEPPLLEEFPEEELIQQIPEITWEGTPRKWIAKPDQPPTYQGEEEGMVKLRFWVDAQGAVVNAIPVQKLSVELEEKALAYIFAWRFEPSPTISLQEGIIQIKFRLNKPDH